MFRACFITPPCIVGIKNFFSGGVVALGRGRKDKVSLFEEECDERTELGDGMHGEYCWNDIKDSEFPDGWCIVRRSMYSE
jgi:hypothetical protein